MSNLALFAGLSWEGKLVSAVLIFLAAAAVVLCRKSRSRLSAEEESELARLNKAIQSQPPDSIQAAEALLPVSSPSLAVRALRDSLHRGRVNRELLAFDQWIHWPRYLAGVFVFIGLCGTVWGIATSVSSLGQAVTSISHATGSGSEAGGSAFTMESWNHLLEGIELLLAGMKSAFVCTLLGLLATLLVSWGNSRYIAACQQVEDQVDALANRVFIPLYRQVHSLQNSAAMQDRLQQAMDALSDNTAQLTQALQPATENLRNISTITTNITRNLQIAADTLKHQNVVAEERSVQIQRILTDLSQRLLLSYQHLENSANALTAAAGSFPEERSALTTLTNEVKTAARQMEVTVRRLAEDLSDAQEEQGDALKSVSESIAATHRTLQGALREFERTLNDVIVTAESPALRQELERLRTELLREVRNVDNRLNTPPAPPRSSGAEGRADRKSSRPASEGLTPGLEQARSPERLPAAKAVTAEGNRKTGEQADSPLSVPLGGSPPLSASPVVRADSSGTGSPESGDFLPDSDNAAETENVGAASSKSRSFMERISGVFKKGPE